MHLKYFNKIPDGFINCHSVDLHDLLGGPSIIEFGDSSKPSVFISILLHGNEYSGLLGVQEFLKSTNNYNCHFVLFIGNTLAAKYGQRHLVNQVDFNRIWADGVSNEHHMAMEVKRLIKKIDPIACIDIHNNSGSNPIYACVNKLKDSYLNLAQLFSNNVVYFTEPNTVLTKHTSQFFPSIVLEAGHIGNPEGIELICTTLKKINENSSIPNVLNKESINAFHTVGTIKIDNNDSLNFKFDETINDGFSLISNFDEFNFVNLSEGDVLGYAIDNKIPEIYSNDDREIGFNYLYNDNNLIKVKKPFIPSMFTKDISIAKSDCLGYLMESIDISKL